MKALKNFFLFITAIVLISLPVLTGCGSGSGGGSGAPLQIEEIDPADIPGTGGTADSGGTSGSGETGGSVSQDVPSTSDDSLHPLFQGKLGVPISMTSLGIIDPDPTGLTVCNDYDGDGILNEEEIMSNEFIADYPRIVTRIAPPITMEIRVSETSSTQNHTETLKEEDISDTRDFSMDERHYTQANEKTVPVVVKESESNNNSQSMNFRFACEQYHGGKDFRFYDNDTLSVYDPEQVDIMELLIQVAMEM